MLSLKIKWEYKNEYIVKVLRGNLMCGIMSFRRALPVDFARGQLAGTPLCMEQYYRLFSSYRYPGPKADTLKVQMNAASSAPEHIIVACKNQVRAPASEETFHTPSHI